MFIDINFFMFARFGETEQGTRARGILNQIKGGTKAFTSVLVLDEFMWVMRREGMQHRIKEVIEDLYELPNLTILPVSSTIPIHAVGFMEQYSLKPRDAFHLAVMRENGIKEIISDDKDFDKVPGIKRRKI